MLKHGDAEMKTVTLEVATLQEVKRRAQAAFTGRKQGARISFATPELLFQLMTAKRWEQQKPYAGRYRTWLSWIDTNPEPSLGATVRSDRLSKTDQVSTAIRGSRIEYLISQRSNLLCRPRGRPTSLREWQNWRSKFLNSARPDAYVPRW